MASPTRMQSMLSLLLGKTIPRWPGHMSVCYVFPSIFRPRHTTNLGVGRTLFMGLAQLYLARQVQCKTPRQIELANGFCRSLEMCRVLDQN